MRQAGERGRASRVIDCVLAVGSDFSVISLAVGSARELGYLHRGAYYDSQKLSVVVITMVALYLAGLYEMAPQVRLRELAWPFSLALGAAGVLLAFLGFAAPPLRLSRLAFLHIIGVVVTLGPLARLYWLRVPRIFLQRFFGNWRVE